MPFSDDDKIIIKHYRIDKKYSAKNLLDEFPNKNWTKGGLDKLLQKIDQTGSVARQEGSGRPKCSRTEENIDTVEQLAMSQENEEPGTHQTLREIEDQTGIPKSSVHNWKLYRY